MLSISEPNKCQRQRPTVPGPRRLFGQIGSVTYQAITDWIEHNDANMGAALAFYTVFSIASWS